MKKVLLCFAAFMLLMPDVAFAQTTFPVNDVQDERSGYYVFVNATIHVDYQTVIEKGMLIVKHGKIEGVMPSLMQNGTKATPAGAAVIDLQGKHIYPAFIDLYSFYGTPEVKRAAFGGGRQGPQMESNKKGAYGWNQAVHPEVQAADIFKVDIKTAEDLRKLGFGAVLTHIPDGISRGTGSLVTLGSEKENAVMLKAKASSHFSFDKGTSTQDYPGSLMGSVALLRQTYLDADWYKKYGYKEQTNISLQAFNDLQSLPQIFEVTNKLSFLRADKIGDEFGVQYIIKGVGDEYQRLAEIKASNAGIILPLNFPQAFDVEDPQDADLVALEDMKHWEMAPANAGILAKNGLSFALTTAGLKNKTDFMPNLRKAIQYGLDEAAALKALTFTPAQLLKAENLVGSLKNSTLANFLVTSGNIFDEKTVIYENWVQGNRFVVNPFPVADMRGVYEFKAGEKNGKLTIVGTAEKPEYKIQIDTLKADVKFTRNGELVTISFDLDKKDKKADYRLTGYISDKTLKGTGEDPDGKPFKWTAIWKEAFKEPEKKSDTKPATTPEIGKIIYPFTAYGSEEKPKAETILIKNATVWTNEKEGKLENTDVLIENGKISKIGKNLVATNAKTIDGTGKHLTPGIIDEHSHIAISQGVNEGTQSVSAEVRIGDVVNSEDVNIYRQLSGGVVASQLLHGSANSIGGQSAFVKLKWGYAPEEMKANIKDGFIKFALGENVKQANWGDASVVRFPQTRMGVEQVMIDAFTRAKEYEKAWQVYNSAKDKTTLKVPRKDLELDALVEILNKKRFITCHSYVQSEITMLMRVAEQFNFKINTFTHILEGYKVADKMVKHGVGGSTFADWWAYKMEVYDAIPYNAALMHKVGVTTTINSDDAEMARRLNQEAGKTVKYGAVSEEDALKFVTLNPAKLMHVEDRMGSIKPGKDADLVLWTDNPLSVYAKADKTIIEGTVFFDLEKDKQLREELHKERTRLIAKMVQAKQSGTATQRPTFKPMKMWHCEDVMDVFRAGETE
jgi:pentatricopeptide repeat protein